MLQLSGVVTMIVVTLLYGGELGASTVLKYWGVFLLFVLLNMFVVHIPLLSPLLQVGVAVAMYSKAKFGAALD
jgi:hypothetical protein